MIRVEVRPECTPSRPLAVALARAGRGAAEVLPWGMVLRIVPRRTDYPHEVRGEAWWSAAWAIPVLAVPGEAVYTAGWLEEGPTVWLEIEPVGDLAAPPELPEEERLAALPPLELENVRPEAVTLYGGEDRLRESMERDRLIAVREDRSADRYDWEAMARRVLGVYESLTPPKLTPAQRVRAAGYRLWKAREEVDNARASLGHLMRNARDANERAGNKVQGSKQDWADWGGVSRPTVDVLLKEKEAAGAVADEDAQEGN